MYEGDPLIRSRLRERMRELLMRNMLKAVPKADVVITNPTHFAVAVEWNRLAMPAPTVTAKGVDVVALQIREVAREAKVPLVENKPLARALYDEVEIGESIPEKILRGHGRDPGGGVPPERKGGGGDLAWRTHAGRPRWPGPGEATSRWPSAWWWWS